MQIFPHTFTYNGLYFHMCSTGSCTMYVVPICFAICSYTFPNIVSYVLIICCPICFPTISCICFNMSAITPITSGLPPFSGVFTPEGVGGFSVFNNEDPNGNWVLTVIDGVAGDIGDLLNFSLSFTNTGYNIVQVGGLPSGSAFPVGTTYNIFSVDLFYNMIEHMDFYVGHWGMMYPDIIEKLRERNKKIFTFTISTTIELDFIRDVDLDGVVTDILIK